MTGMAGCRDIRLALGVYVLGAIDPAERAEVDEHLATCAECREELASLAGLPAMLRKVPLAEAERLAAEGQDAGLGGVPPEDMLPSLIARTAGVRRIRRRRTLATAAAVAAIALGGGALVAGALQPGGPSAGVQQASWQQATGTGPVAGAHLTVRYRPQPWGTLMEVSVTGLAPGSACQFQVTGATGRTSVAGSWVLWGKSTWFPASTSLGDKDLRSFQVTVNGRVVATAPAD